MITLVGKVKQGDRTLSIPAERSALDLRDGMFGFTGQTLTQFRRVMALSIALFGTITFDHASHAAGAASDNPMSLDVLPNRADPRLPVGAPARIIIRYSVENPVALQRATDLARGLTEQGLDVADLVASSEHIVSSTVSYFYLEDRPDAEVAARGLGPAWRSIQQRLPTREPFPRPGALELAVAGP